MPLTLGPLLRWAHEQKLLDGQRNRRLQLSVYPEMRNHFAHGAGHRVGAPNKSARSIRDLAEVINRLWGQLTPGGRVYPAPLELTPVVLAWSPGWVNSETGSELAFLWPEHLRLRPEDDWTYLAVLASDRDHELAAFDARYESTPLPTQLLWGPGTHAEALGWLATADLSPVSATYLDRLFAIRRHNGKVSMPRRADVLLALPDHLRVGMWDVVRADFPMDALAHVRHLNLGNVCTADRYGGCPVDEVARGSWAVAVEACLAADRGLVPAVYSDAHVPQPHPLPDDVDHS